MARHRTICYIFSFTLILFQSSTFAALNTGNITVGQSLIATTNDGSSWHSPSGDFAFGFQQLNSSGQFLLAIWYAKIPDMTIVWWANKGYPVPQGSTVKLTADQGLVLSDPQGTRLWITSTTSDVGYGFMDDTGNFALKSSSDVSIWESFQYPTDTLLPSQIMGRNRKLVSRRSETNFTKGRFRFLLQDDGNLVIQITEPETDYPYIPYYASKTADNTNITTAGNQVVYNDSGHMYLLGNDGSTTDLFSELVSVTDNYQRATMGIDGILAWYSYPRSFTSGNSSWTTIKMLPEAVDDKGLCATASNDKNSGVCGYNSICSLNKFRRPNCRCPERYSLVDPTDTYGSCKPDFILPQCEGYGQSVAKGEYQLVQHDNTDWINEAYVILQHFNEEECKNSCLNDCFCGVGHLNGDNICTHKKFPLSHGIYSTSTAGIAWVKVGNFTTKQFNPSIPPLLKQKTKHNTLLLVPLGGSALVNLFLLCVIGFGALFIYRKAYRQSGGGQRKNLQDFSKVTCFSYQELKDATSEFKEEIGRGAFGIVYKGTIGSGGDRTFIAVKKLDKISNSSDKEYETEVNVIGQTHHKNLVRLIGFCKEEDHRLLVYEYMSNGTLADYLFGDPKPSWRARIQLIQGVARGLLYLHEECSTQIIHCDIKPQNILLDDYLNPRISDFGLAKLLAINQTQTNTAIRGTKGYVAPEWFRNKPVTVKVDVYSFGVLLLEIICCRKSVCLESNLEERAILTDWAFDCYESRALDSLANGDMEMLDDMSRLERFVVVALWCIQEDPSLRPTMRMAILMLEGHAEVPRPPTPASFSIMTQS